MLSVQYRRQRHFVWRNYNQNTIHKTATKQQTSKGIIATHAHSHKTSPGLGRTITPVSPIPHTACFFNVDIYYTSEMFPTVSNNYLFHTLFSHPIFLRFAGMNMDNPGFIIKILFISHNFRLQCRR